MIQRRSTISAFFGLVLVLSALAISACGGSGDGSDSAYRVRAYFGNAFAVTAGQEVRIAGAKVGVVEKVDVDKSRQAILVLRIDEPGFQDFRADAECEIRPQNLIGERFVECKASQPRADETAKQPALRVAKFDGQQQRILPISQTSKPIDIDLVVNTFQLPERQRLAVILNELGTGLAGRGPALRRAIRAALPGLRETDRVLSLVASQNRQLRELATNADSALAPFARNRKALADLIKQVGVVQAAVSERRTELQQSIEKLPATLKELDPTLASLRRLTDESTPALLDLKATAPDAVRLLKQIEPFAKSSRKPIVDLGNTADFARTTLAKADPVVKLLDSVATEAGTLGPDSARLTTSLEETGGFKRIADFTFNEVLALNGYDESGHYFRQNLMVGICSLYAWWPIDGCDGGRSLANKQAGARSAAAQAAANRGQETPEMTLMRRVLSGEKSKDVLKSVEGQKRYQPLLKSLSEAKKKLETAK